jgi:hypothetical protein
MGGRFLARQKAIWQTAVIHRYRLIPRVQAAMLAPSQMEVAMAEQNFPVVQPYIPAQTGDFGLRIAHALEFIAAQLAYINAKMDRLMPKS